MGAGLANEPEVEGEVVDGANLQGEQLLRLIEVVEIGACVGLVDVACAAGVDGREVVGPLGVAHVERALGGEEHGVAAVARRHDAVEHVDAEADGFEDVGGCAYAHEVAWSVLGQDAVDEFNHLVHDVGRFAHGQASDGVAFGILRGYELGALDAQVAVGAALYDGEEALVVAVAGLGLVEALDASVEPVMGELQALAGIVVGGRSRGTFVEGHHDVGSDAAFDVHDALGREEMLAAVDVAAELAPFLTQLAYAGEGKYLEAAGVGQHWAVETVELVESTCGL